MTRLPLLAFGLWILLGATLIRAADKEKDEGALKAALGRVINGKDRTLTEVQEFTEARIPRMPEVKTADEWTRLADRLRADALEKVVFRGEAKTWRDAQTRVEWLATIPGGPGYRIKKLRYEALPGLWIPALLYEPEMLTSRVPVILNVNGHDGKGKAADYKQIRCINQAKRGMLALNVEWLGMGQLRTDGFRHGLINAIDLCGTSGIAVHFLSMKRGLDVLLAHEHADPSRVAVTGLSGGGWQTIFISPLDPRVTLTDPVAGYSSFRTRVRHFSDLGDSEQTPCDLATVLDYAHLTAMMAPHPTLLTFNAKDNCCFAAGHALPPLREAAAPIFRLFGKEKNLRHHVNEDPGDHNYGLDNRQAFYRMLGDHFFPGDASYDPTEIPSEAEVKTADQLQVELPPDNADLHSLALALSQNLPRSQDLPHDKDEARRPSDMRRARLRAIVRLFEGEVEGERVGAEETEGLKAAFWKLKIGRTWTVPAVELSQGERKGTALLIADTGRKEAADVASALLDQGRRVVAVDPFYFGESHPSQKDYLWALMVGTIGERPLGLQAGQVAAIARWLRARGEGESVTVVADGPRTSTIALVAAALEPEAIAGLELRHPLGSLKEVIEQKKDFASSPELFCFGLLKEFDLRTIAALIAPRPIRLHEASERARAELGGLAVLEEPGRGILARAVASRAAGISLRTALQGVAPPREDRLGPEHHESSSEDCCPGPR
ncbi:MAG: hypothetical protein IRY99_11700 [Isosphaeraceae bacterium]|nr:hypothetical protein [Isosphaeraceae bacterium]